MGRHAPVGIRARVSNPLLRLARADDFSAIAEITNHYIRTTAIHFAAHDIRADELAEQHRVGGDVHPWLVAEVDGTVRGYAKASRWRERDAYRFTCETGVYVEHRWLGRGLGRALMQRLIRLLGDQGYRSIVAGVALPNDPSVRLHEALGFRSVGVVRDAGFKFEKWHDVGFWQLRLREDAAPPRLLTVTEAFARGQPNAT